jgi:hypothetical protein
VDRADLAEDARLDDRGLLAEAVQGGALVAHHRGQALLPRDVGHHTGFVDVTGHGLLAEAVLAHLHRHHGRDRMGVVGRADGHGVDLVAEFVEHAAIVIVGLGFLEAAFGTLQRRGIDIAHADHLAVTSGIGRVAASLATDADAGKLDLLVRRLGLREAHAARSPVAHAHGGRGLHEFTSTRFDRHCVSSPDCSRKIVGGETGWARTWRASGHAGRPAHPAIRTLRAKCSTNTPTRSGRLATSSAVAL